MNIQWYPGHMAKTRRQIAEKLKLIDIVVELLDARLPRSSKNPDIDALTAGKPRLIVLNKADLADEEANRAWAGSYAELGMETVLMDSAHQKNAYVVFDKIKKVLADKIARRQEKGMVRRSVKVLVVGIPNVGKSTFINKLAGRAGAQTGDRPGVTRGQQWIRLQSGMELLDTPGILWPKFDSEETALHLAFVGSIKDDIMDVESLAARLLGFLNENYRPLLAARYKLPDTEGISDFDLLELVGKKRGFVVSGGEIDTYRAANIALDEFRAGKLGRITLELP